MKVLIVGGGAREHAMAAAVARSGGSVFAVLKNRNPGIMKLATEHAIVPETDATAIVERARAWAVDVAVIGMESAIEAGVGDALADAGVKLAAPSRAAGAIETNKAFMRTLLDQHEVPGRCAWREFRSPTGLLKYVSDLGAVAVKPVGLTGGKGVKVMGDHLASVEKAVAYAEDVIAKGYGGASVIIEELLVGEEFSLMAFTDGKTLAFMPAVQDHKRAFEGDEGPNTGGMGSYSDAGGSLPFLAEADLEGARAAGQAVIDALRAEGSPYVGTIYLQFMATANGPKFVEVNARFGDPEAMNVMELLKTPYTDVLNAMASGTLADLKVEWHPLASVCKYVVPEGYGSKPMANEPLAVDEAAVEAAGARAYYAAVNADDAGALTTTTSRAVGIVATAPTLDEAEANCEKALAAVTGPHLFMRHDIGKRALVEKRIAHMKQLRG